MNLLAEHLLKRLDEPKPYVEHDWYAITLRPDPWGYDRVVVGVAIKEPTGVIYKVSESLKGLECMFGADIDIGSLEWQLQLARETFRSAEDPREIRFDSAQFGIEKAGTRRGPSSQVILEQCFDLNVRVAGRTAT